VCVCVRACVLLHLQPLEIDTRMPATSDLAGKKALELTLCCTLNG